MGYDVWLQGVSCNVRLSCYFEGEYDQYRIQYYYGALQALQRKKGSILGVKTYPPSIHSSREGGGGGEGCMMETLYCSYLQFYKQTLKKLQVQCK
jgi:hypothetical protein